MRKGLNLLRLILSVLIGLLALVFAVIEGRNLFSGDWLIYEYAFNGLVRYMSRLLLALFALSQGILPLINLKRKSLRLARMNLAGSVGLVVMSVFLFAFATNYVGEAALGIALIYFVLVLVSELPAMRSKKRFCFTVDDNIRCLKEITERQYESIFDHPYLAVYRRLHDRFNLCVQLNLFYEMDGFDLTQMTDRYLDEWKENAAWLKLSFHSKLENVKPYEYSGYEEVYADCQKVHREIKRFASENVLANTTTVHYCLATEEGLRALKDNGVRGLLGLYGSDEQPRKSYQTSEEENVRMRGGEIAKRDGIAYAGIDIVLNRFSVEEIMQKLSGLLGRKVVKVMIHEQYFYPDYPAYQREFEEKLIKTFSWLKGNGYCSSFFEDII